MGQKVHPIGFRLGVIRTWDSKWFDEKNYAQWLREDIKIRAFVKKSLTNTRLATHATTNTSHVIFDLNIACRRSYRLSGFMKRTNQLPV